VVSRACTRTPRFKNTDINAYGPRGILPKRRDNLASTSRSGDIETYFFGENSAVRLAAGKTSAEFRDATCTAKRFVVNIIAPSSGVLTGGG